jgi:hypothetical protein
MADRYWVGGTGTWNATNTNNWSAASALRFTALRSGNTLTTTGSPALVVGMTVWSATNVNLGTITAGSGNTWTTSGSGTVPSQSMTAATIGASVPSIVTTPTPIIDNVYFDANSGTGTHTVTYSQATAGLTYETISFLGGSGGAVGSSAFTGTLTSGGTTAFSVSGNFAYSATMNGNFSVATITFTSSVAGRTITSNGKTTFNGTGNVIFNGTGSWTLTDNFTQGITRQITLTQGTIVANADISTGLFIVGITAVAKSITVTNMYLTGVGTVYSQAANTIYSGTIQNLYVTSSLTTNQKEITTNTVSGIIQNLYFQGTAARPTGVNNYAISGVPRLGNVYFQNTSPDIYDISIVGNGIISGNLDFGTTKASVAINNTTIDNGNLILSPNAVYTNIASSRFEFTGSNNNSITSYGQSFGSIRIIKTTGSNLTLLNTGPINARTVELRSGNLVLNSNLGCTQFDSSTSVTGNRTINIGTNTIELYGDASTLSGGTLWTATSVSPNDILSFISSSGAKIYINPVASAAYAAFRNITSGASIDYANVTIDINPDRLIYITGSNQFKGITNSAPATTGTGILQFESSATTTVEDFTVNGSYSAGNRYLIRLQQNSVNRHVLWRTSTSPMVPVNFLSIGGIDGYPLLTDPGALYFKASCNCVNRGNNSEWFFLKCSKLPLLGVG